MFTYILIAALTTMAVSLSGVIFLKGLPKIRKNIGLAVAFSAGAFLSVSIVQLLPEAFELLGRSGSWYVLGGILFFYVLSYLLTHYHHHHQDATCDDCNIEDKATANLVLIGDSIHNFIDGIIIASSFTVSLPVGIAAAVGIWGHEIAQEIADYFILIKAGYSNKQALLYNFLASSSVLIGALAGYFLLSSFEGLIGPLLGIAAGNLLYLAVADLLPELNHTEKNSPSVFWKYLGMMGLGILVVSFGLKFDDHSHDSDSNQPATEVSQELPR